MFQDAALASQSAAVRTQALNELDELGVDTLHVLINWRELVPRPHARRRPPNFRGDSPDDYRPSRWRRYDDLFREALERGFDLLVTPNGPAPRWADARRPNGGLASYKPDFRLFGRFVRALGTRYSGSYVRLTDDQLLPRIERWSCWNEPNQAGWLQPQSSRSPLLGRFIPRAPHIYRRLYRACYRSLFRTGHGGDQILLGELAPLGSRKPTRMPSLAPGVFLREMFCLDRNYRPFTGIQAVARGCQAFRKIRATGFAHHPYIKKPMAPTSIPRRKDWMPIGATQRLLTVLRKSAARRRISGRLPIYFTEFGVQTYPPDRHAGISLDKQAEYLNVSEYLAYRQPRVHSWAQYALCDDPPLGKRPADYSDEPFGGFQTGLKFDDCTPKPSLDAYRLPIYVRRVASDEVRIWGLVRPLARRLADAPPGETPTVQIETRRSGAFSPVGQPIEITSPRGYFERIVTLAGAARQSWRFAWTDPSGKTFRSRNAVAAST